VLDHAFLIIIIALVLGFIMTWGVGANDLANILSTSIGSRSVSVKQALMIAVVFEFAGALLGGSHVTNTIRSGIINASLLSHQPDILLFGMLSVLLASGIWMLFASYIGMPVSITNATVGSLVGFGVVVLGPHAIYWGKVGAIALSWVLSPTIAGVVAYLLFLTIKRTIFDTQSPASSINRFFPFYFFLVGLVLANMVVLKGLVHLGWQLDAGSSFLIVLIVATLIMLLGLWLARFVPYPPNEKRFRQHIYVEKRFSILMLFTACAMVFAHGSNDVAIAMGPIAAIISLVRHNGQIVGAFPYWILWFGGFGVIVGLFMYGRKVIATVGSNITDLTPSRAFAATLAGASTVICSTSFGIPVSATQTLVGGVLGIGLARGLAALNVTTVRNIFMSWLVTVPAGAGLSIVIFYVLKDLFA
jgi:inorganic phosphate transporter, PiT family